MVNIKKRLSDIYNILCVYFFDLWRYVMEIELLKIHEYRAGMVLAKDVYSEKGSVLIPTGTVLSDLMIDRIILENVPYIWVLNDDNYIIADEEESSSMKEVKKEYSKQIEKIKNIFNVFAEGGFLDEDVKEVASSIVNSDKFSGDLLRCMRQLRNFNDYIYQHSLNVSSLCCLIGNWMNMSIDEVEELTLAGLLHDIGKSKVNPEILEKTTELNCEEVMEIQRHCEYGYQMLKKNTKYSDDILKAVLMHHEREDGTGYPSKLKSKDIHPYAKVIAVADLYSAITLDRIYKRTDTPFSVFEIFESASSQKFDPLVVYTIISNIAMYYIGDRVRLTNGMFGNIVFIDKEFISRPLIHCQNGQIIDLRLEKDVKISQML
jgi:putative nucleotidyltransferase with HDIG domain